MTSSRARTLQYLYSDLINGLQFSIGSISDQCYAKGLISKDTYTDIICQSNPGKAQLRVLLLDVTKNIDKNNNFDQFVGILQQDQSLLSLAEALVEREKKFVQGQPKNEQNVDRTKSGLKDSGRTSSSIVIVVATTTAVVLFSMLIYHMNYPSERTQPAPVASNPSKFSGQSSRDSNDIPTSHVDKTSDAIIYTPQASGPDVVNECIKKLKSPLFGMTDSHLFMKRVAYVMSGYGRSMKHSGGGIWQLSQFAFRDTQDYQSHSRLKNKYKRIYEAFEINWLSVTYKDLEMPFYSALAARLYLSNDPEEIPKDVHGQAKYWKYNYMRGDGEGDVSYFIRKVQEMENH